MSYMDKNMLSVKELSELIRISAKAGLSELKFGDLELRFGKPTVNIESKSSVKEITESEHDKINKDTLEVDSIRAKQDQIEQMFIENPTLAEQLIIDGDLEDDGREEG